MCYNRGDEIPEIIGNERGDNITAIGQNVDRGVDIDDNSMVMESSSTTSDIG